ncbi:MAG: hypothetical protein ACD_46C00222G0008 [uncultured bacterium]|nr:MAG: hypothetical protein ACD_46C00222G0008 [uncultured bacterium]
MNLRNIILAFSVIFISSCSFLSPVQTEPSAKYLLNTLPHHIPQKAKRSVTLLVLNPETRAIFNTTDMAYTKKTFQVSYYAENQWAETPSQMLLPLIVQTLQKTNHFKAIVTPPYAGQYDYALSTQITQFQQDFTVKPAMFTISIRADITRTSTGRLIASKQFTYRIPINHPSPYSGVIAANIASAKLLQDLAKYCLDYM